MKPMRDLPTSMTLAELKRVVNRIYDQIDSSSETTQYPSAVSPRPSYSSAFGTNPASVPPSSTDTTDGGSTTTTIGTLVTSILEVVEDGNTGEPAIDAYGYGYFSTETVDALAGADGARGPQGITGAQGPQGIQGIQGPQGVKGDKGDKGDTGTGGKISGVGYSGTSSVLQTNANIPADDTIPQISEGYQVAAVTYTPVEANSTMYVEAEVLFQTPSAGAFMVALFTSNSTDAFSASAISIAAGLSDTIRVHGVLPSVSTSPLTLSVRIGNLGASTTFTINGSSGNRYAGGTLNSYIKVTEVRNA